MYTRVNHLGQPLGLPMSFPPEDDNDWIPIVYPGASTNPDQVLVWSIIAGRCVGQWTGSADPQDRIVTHDEVKTKQLELELSSIEVFGVLIDCDDRSEKFMRDALETWDVREVEPGVFEDMGIPGELQRVLWWKDANNQFAPITKDMLQAMYDGMKVQRAARAQKIWAKAQFFKLNLPTLRVLNDVQQWIT